VFIFLDSSVIYNNFHLDTPNFESIKTLGTIVLCKVVIEEIIAKHHERLSENLNKINSEIQFYNVLSETKIKSFDISVINDESKKYRDFIEIFIIENGMTVAESYSNVSHEEIVKRAIARKKPFDATDRKGYRDFLIWKTFLEVVRTYSTDDFHFITYNKNDLSNSIDEKQLHPDLVEDIRVARLDGKHIRYWSSIQEFVDVIVKPKLAVIEEKDKLKEELLNNQDNFVSPIEELVTKYLLSECLDGYSDLLLWGSKVKVAESYGIEFEEITEISLLSENEFFIETQLLSDCIIHSYIAKSELKSFSKKELRNINIVNLSFDKSTAVLEDLVPLRIEVTVVFQKDIGKIKSFEIKDISYSSYCHYCPYPDDYDEDDGGETND